jgi:hypothetical protein
LVLGLLAGIGGTLAFGLVDSLNGLWLSMLPSALLSHQFLVLKALASDWAQAAGSSAAQRGAVMGQLGTAVKLCSHPPLSLSLFLSFFLFESNESAAPPPRRGFGDSRHPHFT